MTHPTPDFDPLITRTLRGVPALPRRKRLMRDELLAHLLDSYHEELHRLDPDSAARAAAHRLGHPAALRRQLRDSVPTIERIAALILSPKEIPMSRWLWLLAVILTLMGTSMILPALGRHFRNHHEWSVVAYPLTVGIVIALAGLSIATYGTAARLRRSAQ
jgi:hypothetical protein